MTSTQEKQLRLAACIGHQVGEGKDIKDAVDSAARYFDIAPASVWECVRFAQEYIGDTDIAKLATA